MEDLFSQKQYAKNIYVIRKNLSDLRLLDYNRHWEYVVGKYVVKIYPPSSSEGKIIGDLLSYNKFDIFLYENVRSLDKFINLASDERFKDYSPIIYDVVQGINFSTGKNMPLGALCELISYIHRLSDLVVFL